MNIARTQETYHYLFIVFIINMMMTMSYFAASGCSEIHYINQTGLELTHVCMPLPHLC